MWKSYVTYISSQQKSTAKGNFIRKTQISQVFQRINEQPAKGKTCINLVSAMLVTL